MSIKWDRLTLLRVTLDWDGVWKLTTSMGLASRTGRLETELTCTHMPLGFRKLSLLGVHVQEERALLLLSSLITTANQAILYQTTLGQNFTTQTSCGTDRQQCGGLEVTCCNPPNLPWFCKTFPTPITDDLEVRICLDEAANNENVALEFFELYIQG